jgi:hypothetical protein
MRRVPRGACCERIGGEIRCKSLIMQPVACCISSYCTVCSIVDCETKDLRWRVRSDTLAEVGNVWRVARQSGKYALMPTKLFVHHATGWA